MKNIPVLKDLAGILIVSSFPPRVCGIATYTRDLTYALQNKFGSSLSIKICALESDETSLLYSPDVKYILKTSSAEEYEKTAAAINSDPHIKIVLIHGTDVQAGILDNWEWFEGCLTYANSILPEAMLYAWLLTSDKEYKDIALSSFGFLLSRTFNSTGIKVISNKKWLMKGQEPDPLFAGGEQPIDVACTIMTLSKFYSVFVDKDYQLKMERAFNWFLGDNRLHQIVYNPYTGGCYDGLEEFHVNLNQGAESTLSYLMARLTIGNNMKKNSPVKSRMFISNLEIKN